MRALLLAGLAGLRGGACAARGPATDADDWPRHAVRLDEGEFSLHLPRGWRHTPSVPGLYPRGTDGDGPYRSTLWTRGSHDYFHQWMQPDATPAMERAPPRAEWRATDDVRRREMIRGREGVVETRTLAPAMVPAPRADECLYCAAATIRVGPRLWLVVRACVTSRAAQDEMLAAFRTIEFAE